jgi:uncharacterized protein YjbI with pentapeptide repeats
MANQEQLDILKQGVETWNQWRKEHADIIPDLSEADLSGADLIRADLSEANLYGADLREAILSGADLSEADLSKATLNEAILSEAELYEADLSGADLRGADLSRANLYGADLREAILSRADLSEATLSGATLSRATLSRADLSRATLSEATLSRATLSRADLSEANLDRAILVETDLRRAILTKCSIYGISAWNVQVEGAKQDSLVITRSNEPTITVDNLEVAQFIYLLLNNPKIRDVIDTIAKKAVLILGRFTLRRKAVLDAFRESLRIHGYLPILFDFEKPSSRNMTETVRTLAHLSRFIIADLTDPSSIPQELYAIVPTLAIPVQPVLLEGKKEYAMLSDLSSTYHWMLPIHFYKDQADLLTTLKEQVIAPAEQKAMELEKR